MLGGVRRILRWCLVGMLVLSVASGCGPAVRGVGGVRLDAGGGLVAVLAWCPDFGDPTTVILYPVNPDGSVGDPLLSLKRTGAAPAGRYLEIAISNPPPGWSSDTAAAVLDDPGRTYEVRAWNQDGTKRITNFPFQLGELRQAPEPGTSILTKEHVGNGRYDSSFRTPTQLREATDRMCG
jgi:hypothetical protein